MRIRVLRDRDWTPPEERRITIAYRAGTEVTIKRAWGEALVAAGDAEEIPSPPRSEPFNGADPAKFDHDGRDGPGGSPPKAEAED